MGEGRFIGCAQLLLVWFHSHFWKVDKVSYQIFSENYSPLKELTTTPRRDNITILYRCGDFDWVSLLRIWGVVGYAPLLVLKQYRLRQFVPATQGLSQSEFSYKNDGYKKKIREVTNAWKKGKNKAEEDLDSLKVDYKKLRRSIRTVGLGRTSEQWRQEIQEEKTKADQWEKKFQDARAREVALEKSLLE
ncbi:hypothetical protein Goklo_025315 [Gossypium klotzschianum]|uniref:DUF7745 domain-containing protein n=1 Tax=Gossypium klotzschianum TaxID=34286 RepID=A0A7J8W796_9ROSI|nr:hypothetical protein [Gossypium klotzschianum]